jgi:hypothetical protein
MRFNSYLSLLCGAAFFAFCATSCRSGSDNASQADTTKSNQLTTASSVIATDTVVEGGVQDTGDYAVCYVTVADTGRNYYKLHMLMTMLHDKLNVPIDTMNRHYDAKKDNIVVADNDEDEMYRGEYFPRRFPSAYLSLEYYTTYADESSKKNIALVAGIYDAKSSADSALAAIRAVAPRSFVVKGRVFVGCMH